MRVSSFSDFRASIASHQLSPPKKLRSGKTLKPTFAMGWHIEAHVWKPSSLVQNDLGVYLVASIRVSPLSVQVICKPEGFWFYPLCVCLQVFAPNVVTVRVNMSELPRSLGLLSSASMRHLGDALPIIAAMKYRTNALGKFQKGYCKTRDGMREHRRFNDCFSWWCDLQGESCISTPTTANCSFRRLEGVLGVVHGLRRSGGILPSESWWVKPFKQQQPPKETRFAGNMYQLTRLYIQIPSMILKRFQPIRLQESQ